jgi:hypothetical protein
MRRYPTNRLKFLRTRGKKTGRLWLTINEVAKLRDISPSSVMKHELGKLALDERDIIDYAHIYKVKSYEIFVPTPPQ